MAFHQNAYWYNSYPRLETFVSGTAGHYATIKTILIMVCRKHFLVIKIDQSTNPIIDTPLTMPANTEEAVVAQPLSVTV